MSEKYSKAIRVSINIGDSSLDVYQLPNGDYDLAGKQITDVIDEPNNSLYRFYGVKTLKALPHKGLGSIQPVKTNEGGSFIPVSIDVATKYWMAMAVKGNVKAQALLEACLAESIERRADHALGIQVSEQERNERMELRMKRVKTRYNWTDSLKARYEALNGVAPSKKHYQDWTVKANLALFKQPHFCCDRDTMTVEQQRIIEGFEYLCCRWANKYPTDNPDQILERVLATF